MSRSVQSEYYTKGEYDTGRGSDVYIRMEISIWRNLVGGAVQDRKEFVDQFPVCCWGGCADCESKLELLVATERWGLP